MSEETQRTAAPNLAAAAVGLGRAKSLLQYQNSLLRFSAGNAATLLFRYPSSLLTLWADNAPRPFFQYHSSVLRLWAGSWERAARNFEATFEALEQSVQNPPTRLSEDEQPSAPLGLDGRLNEPMLDQIAEAAQQAVDASAETPQAVAVNQLTTAEFTAAKHGRIKATKTPSASAKKSSALQKAASRKRIATRTMKSRRKKKR